MSDQGTRDCVIHQPSEITKIATIATVYHFAIISKSICRSYVYDAGVLCATVSYMKSRITVGKRRCLHRCVAHPGLFNRILAVCTGREMPAMHLLPTSNVEQHDEYRIASFRAASKRAGISGIARLHNSAIFLEVVVQSWLELCDEIVLIDNASTDSTPAICSSLQQRYPDKIRFLTYPFAVAHVGSVAHQQTPADSVHSLVYYYNRAFAQARFQTVVKIDDDNLFIASWHNPQVLKAQILQMPANTYMTFSGYNVQRHPGEHKYMLLPVAMRYSGLVGDIGWYVQTEHTVFYKDVAYEKLARRHLRWQRAGMCYIHLKYCKPEFATHLFPGAYTYDAAIASLLETYVPAPA